MDPGFVQSGFRISVVKHSGRDPFHPKHDKSQCFWPLKAFYCILNCCKICGKKQRKEVYLPPVKVKEIESQIR